MTHDQPERSDARTRHAPRAATKQEVAKREAGGLSEGDAGELEAWLARQARLMWILNVFLVLTNLALMGGGYWLVPAMQFLPRIVPEWTLGEQLTSFFVGSQG